MESKNIFLWENPFHPIYKCAFKKTYFLKRIQGASVKKHLISIFYFN